MKHDACIRSPDPDRPFRIRLLALLAVAGVLAASTPSGANQVFKACGKKWLRQVEKLPPEQLAWLLETRFTEITKDLDGDGAVDTLTLTNLVPESAGYYQCLITNLGGSAYSDTAVLGVSPSACTTDINGGGVIDAADLGILLGVFGASCP